jgi:ABC-type phosphate/phosphonate transport system permease subunit
MVSLIFDRRISVKTPGTFRTKVITEGVDPQISCYYRASRITQYVKEHRALRTETVIGDTHDFGIGRRVTSANWRALRQVGEHANQAQLANQTGLMLQVGAMKRHDQGVQ